jgi:hypothetical protein
MDVAVIVQASRDDRHVGFGLGFVVEADGALGADHPAKAASRAFALLQMAV